MAFPPSGSALWKDYDSELTLALPAVFSDRVIRTLSTTELSTKLDNWLYHFFEERCGLLPVRDFTDLPPPKPHRHRGLERLRSKKKECRAATRALTAAGLTDTDAFRVLTQRWRTLTRTHNNLRVAVKTMATKREQLRAEAQFKKSPHAFAGKLFTDSKSAAPTFSEEEAMAYFAKTYRDEGRDDQISPLEDMVRPDLPDVLFASACPTVKQIADSVKPKSNGAAAGMNALTYVVYKKCHAIIVLLQKIFAKIWRTKDVPADWAAAFIVLLSKDADKLHVPSEFRPIAITNTVGKIFFSIVSSRLQTFLTANKYIVTATQKGFLSGIAGCVEHSFTLFEALREAKEEQRQIVATWIDLANAYGSVRHNLIQFALNWYHVPRYIQELIFDYYNKLMAKVTTKAWTTGFFLFDIGLFQGCVLSTILFDCVFQLLLDFLADAPGGYEYKAALGKRLSRAYADDLNLTATTCKHMQGACDRCDVWLAWTKTMHAKPRKCISFAMRQFDARFKAKPGNAQFTPTYGTKHSAFDPLITIAGQKMHYILNPDIAEGKLTRDHFKFLGRWIHIDLCETKVQAHVRASFQREVKLVNSCHVNGLMKLWLYQYYLLAHLSWPFLIHDFPISFARELESSMSTTLKRWTGLYRGADVGSLFRSRAFPGSLGLTSISKHFVKMQVIRSNILQTSKDTLVKSVYEARASRTMVWKVKFSAAKTTASLTADAKLDHLFPTQSSNRGLGHGDFNANPTTKEFRGLITKAADKRTQEEHFAHAIPLSWQGRWTEWHEKTVPFDLSWKNLIYGPGPHVIKFVLNATINSCLTPQMRVMWGYKGSAACKHCGEQCTLHHILVGCHHALSQGRYTWRHDSVLLRLHGQLSLTVKAHNSTHRPNLARGLGKLLFVTARPKGAASTKTSAKPTPPSTSILDGAVDWKLLADLGHDQLVFPPEIYATIQRPDAVLFSKSLHKVIIVELTVPAEEGIEAAQLRKEARYLSLCEAINKDKISPWSAHLYTVEAGARGFVARSMLSFLRKVGCSSREARTTCGDISVITTRCSYYIYLCRDAEFWDSSRDLLSIHVAPAPTPATSDDFTRQWKHTPQCLSFYGRPCTCKPPS